MNIRLAILAVTLIVLTYFSEANAAKDISEEWRQDKACGHKVGDQFQVDVPGCDDAYCVNTSTSSQVCACLISKESGTTQMTYKRNGGVVLQWKTNIYPPAIASGLRVDTADLNGDGKNELIIATLISASNGMGIESWEVSVISNDRRSNSVVVEDYGIMGYFSSDDKQCRLLVTRWIEGWDPEKGNGLYLAGRWFQLYDHSLEYSNNRPVIKRRYLNSLRQLRAQGFQNKKSVQWFRDSATTPIIGPYPFRD
jgi:hypothetical protein